MSIVHARPDLRTSKSLRVDSGDHIPGPKLVEVTGPDVEPEALNTGKSRVIESKPTTEAERMAAWFDEEVRLAYPDTWGEVVPNPLMARVWVAAGFDLAEMQDVAGPIIRGGCPLDDLIDRIGDAITERMAERVRRQEAREREEAEARAKGQAEGGRSMFRRLIAESAGRYEQARATAVRIERRELEEDEYASWEVLGEVDRQARMSLRLAERDLAARLEGALPWLAPDMKARDADGWAIPFGIVVEGVAYLLVGDPETQDEEAVLIERMPLDRIIGLG